MSEDSADERDDHSAEADADPSAKTESRSTETESGSAETESGSSVSTATETFEADDAEDDADPFGDDFASALADVDVPTFDADDGPVAYGHIDFELGVETPDLSEEPDSDIPRIELGIEGLDAMIQGGVPERSLMTVIGSAGTGKTTFGFQFLEAGLRQGESGVFIALEERRERVLRSATEKGFPFDEYEADGTLAVVDIDPVEMATSLSSIRGELPRLIEDFGASRLVLDSVSLLEMMYDDRSVRRNEIFEFTQALKNAGVTALLTSEAAESTPYASRHGIVEYLTDAVFILQYVRGDQFRETRLAVEIQKIRDANHSRETKPYELTAEGIAVYEQANLF